VGNERKPDFLEKGSPLLYVEKAVFCLESQGFGSVKRTRLGEKILPAHKRSEAIAEKRPGGGGDRFGRGVEGTVEG